MSTAQNTPLPDRSHWPEAALRTWVATNGCWTTAQVLFPHSDTAIWLSAGLGLLISHMTGWISHRIAADRPVLSTSVASLPTLLGLVAAAVSTQLSLATGGTLATMVAG